MNDGEQFAQLLNGAYTAAEKLAAELKRAPIETRDETYRIMLDVARPEVMGFSAIMLFAVGLRDPALSVVLQEMNEKFVQGQTLIAKKAH